MPVSVNSVMIHSVTSKKDLEELDKTEMVYFRKVKSASALTQNCPEFILCNLYYYRWKWHGHTDYVKLSSSVYGNSDSAAIVQRLLWRFL